MYGDQVEVLCGKDAALDCAGSGEARWGTLAAAIIGSIR